MLAQDVCVCAPPYKLSFGMVDTEPLQHWIFIRIARRDRQGMAEMQTMQERLSALHEICGLDGIITRAQRAATCNLQGKVCG